MCPDGQWENRFIIWDSGLSEHTPLIREGWHDKGTIKCVTLHPRLYSHYIMVQGIKISFLWVPIYE